MKKLWRIWSIEHDGWWKPNSNGYTQYKGLAGNYSYEEALEIVKNANRHRRDDEAPNEAMVQCEDEE